MIVKKILGSSFISAIILCVITLLAGCSVGIRPAYYDLPPINDNQNYYGGSASSQYYTPPTSEYRTDYNSSYDPWTMGTYYDNYTPPQRVSRDSQNSSGSTDSTIGDRRPTIRDRSTDSEGSMAPKKDNPIPRRERTVQKESTNTNSGSSTSSTASQKTKREPNTSTGNSSEIQNNQSNSTSDSNKEDDEKQKRKRGVTN
jgi:hypothetical protein